MEIKFSSWQKHKNKPDSELQEIPVLELIQDRWDDYGYKNLYTMWFVKSPKNRERIGQVKIMSSEDGDYDSSGFLNLDGYFYVLDDSYYSLGQDADFYVNISKIFPEDYYEILTRFRDVAWRSSLVDEIDHSDRYINSLIRYSEAETALNTARSILTGENPVYANYSFGFSCNIGDAPADHVAQFSFDKFGPINRSVNVVIGENGTGKTQFLAKLALAMSGEKKGGIFLGKRPPFTKVIALSYSAFENFEIPGNKRTFSYSYCGIRDGNSNDLLSVKQMADKYRVASDKISRKGKVRLWRNVLSQVLPGPVIEKIHEELFLYDRFQDVAKGGKVGLSSGQRMLLYTFTSLIANIRTGSLILFDEPEIHLHPFAVSKIIKMLDFVLSDFESYAIVATHSPIILQDIPSSSVICFQRDGDAPVIGSLGFEPFGENFTNITNSVFKVSSEEPRYKVILKELSRSYSFDQVMGFFEGRLSFSAEIYLKGCYSDEDD